MNNYHKSVLLQETIDALRVKRGQKYIDATLGGGGHTKAILDRGGIVLGIDVDEDSFEFVSKDQELEIKNQKLKLAKGNFRNIDKIAKENGFEKPAGILFDLGVSSHQVDDAKRGFSYLKSGPLDMRMDKGLGVKASDLINALGRRELVAIFRNFGEETRTNKVVEIIISRRKIAPFITTDDLTLTLATAYGFRDVTDFAKATSGKKVFQALRIAVNDELGSLEEALPKAMGLLKGGGRLAVISFHSLEDRIVKRAFLQFEKIGNGRIITNKPIVPKEQEAKENSRSRESKLRIIEKI